MKNIIPIENGRKKSLAPAPRRMNECISEAADWPRLVPLFDEFWREGELALLFGASGAGKSILATQIAEALARGSGIEGFSMPAGGRRVLHVDLQHADFQIRARYTTERGRRYKFSDRLFRMRPPADDEDFIKWLRGTLAAGQFDVVIVDDLASLRNTNDGTREVLKIMRGLKRLRDEMMVSILVLTDSSESRGKRVSMSDLGRSRVLCSVADSVFAIGETRTGQCRIVQMGCRNARVVWNEINAPAARITRLDSGMLSFEFDDRFVPDLSHEESDLVQKIKMMRDARKSFRLIAEELAITKTRAHRLMQKWEKLQRLRDLVPGMPMRSRRRKLFDDNEEEEEYYDPNPIVIADTFPGCEEYDKARAKCDQLDDDDSPEAQALISESYMIQLARTEAMEDYRKTGRTPRLAEMLERIKANRAAAARGDLSVVTSVWPTKPVEPGPFDFLSKELEYRIDHEGRDIWIERECEHTRQPLVWYTVNDRGQKLRMERRLWAIFVSRVNEEPKNGEAGA